MRISKQIAHEIIKYTRGDMNIIVLLSYLIKKGKIYGK
jgi:hypothetical protein